MKFLTAITLAASAASAATLERKQAPSKSISSFTAACVPHSTFCDFSFEVSSDPSLPPSHCAAHVQGPDRLPALADGKCEDNGAYTWGFVRDPEGGARLGVSYPLNSRSNITYCGALAASDFVIDNNGAVQTERYTGPKDFEITWAEC